MIRRRRLWIGDELDRLAAGRDEMSGTGCLLAAHCITVIMTRSLHLKPTGRDGPAKPRHCTNNGLKIDPL